VVWVVGYSYGWSRFGFKEEAVCHMDRPRRAMATRADRTYVSHDSDQGGPDRSSDTEDFLVGSGYISSGEDSGYGLVQPVADTWRTRGVVAVTPCQGAALLFLWLMMGAAASIFVCLGLNYRGPPGPGLCGGLAANRTPHVCFLRKLDNESWEVQHNVLYFSSMVPRVKVGAESMGLYAPGRVFVLDRPGTENNVAEWRVRGCWDSGRKEYARFVVYQVCPLSCYVNATEYGGFCKFC
jgi:hypothetical protein